MGRYKTVKGTAVLSVVPFLYALQEKAPSDEGAVRAFARTGGEMVFSLPPPKPSALPPPSSARDICFTRYASHSSATLRASAPAALFGFRSDFIRRAAAARIQKLRFCASLLDRRVQHFVTRLSPAAHVGEVGAATYIPGEAPALCPPISCHRCIEASL